MHPVEQKLSEAIVSKLADRFEKIRNRAFAPFRVLRYRMILQKVRIALYGKNYHCSSKQSEE